MKLSATRKFRYLDSIILGVSVCNDLISVVEGKEVLSVKDIVLQSSEEKPELSPSLRISHNTGKEGSVLLVVVPFYINNEREDNGKSGEAGIKSEFHSACLPALFVFIT
jgi:hypothetical protein